MPRGGPPGVLRVAAFLLGSVGIVLPLRAEGASFLPPPATFLPLADPIGGSEGGGEGEIPSPSGERETEAPLVNVWDLLHPPPPEPVRLPRYRFGLLGVAQFQIATPGFVRPVSIVLPLLPPVVWLADGEALPKQTERYENFSAHLRGGGGAISSEKEGQLLFDFGIARRFLGIHGRYRRIFEKAPRSDDELERSEEPTDHLSLHFALHPPPRRHARFALHLGARVRRRVETKLRIGFPGIKERVTRTGLEVGLPAIYSLHVRAALLLRPWFTYFPDTRRWFVEEDGGVRFWLSERFFSELVFNLLIEESRLRLGPMLTLGLHF
ncbi:MAG: hypothetical protein D6812_04715 [Deltaproteobacteria bacterium]|nr:MAG: hypothetical protein D6812_04715 [Deltaproteobacteria bacterium]